MRQVAVLWIHTDSTPQVAGNVWSHLALKDVVVAFLAYHLKRTDAEDAFLAVLVGTNVYYLKTDSVGQALLVDDVADGVSLASQYARSWNVPA